MSRLRRYVLALVMAVAVILSVPVAALAEGEDAQPEISIIEEGASNITYNIGANQAMMIYGESTDSIVFENCTFNLSDKTVKISGDRSGIECHNGEVVTKLWIGGNVSFVDCTFVTAEGAGKSTSAGYDAAIYIYSGEISLKDCTLSAEGYDGQFLGLYGSKGATTFDHSSISTVDNKNGWSYAMYGGSVLKLTNGSEMTATGSSTDSGNINCFYSGDARTNYDAIFINDSTVDFSDNQAGGFAINNVNIHVNNSNITVNNNSGSACNSGMWYLENKSTLTMNGNRGGHGLSCIGIEAEESTIDIEHNGYAGLYLQSQNSKFVRCTVDIACNGEKMLSYSAGDVWLQNHTLTVDDCTSAAQSGSAWLGAVGRTGKVITTEGSSVVAYDLNSNSVDNLKSNTAPVLEDATIALGEESNAHTLILNPFMESDYARGNAENTSSNNDADLFEDQNVTTSSDITGADKAKIGKLTDAQLSHHKYDWANGTVSSPASATDYGAMSYPCVFACDDYAQVTTDHQYSFNCQDTKVYSPLVGVQFVGNAGNDTVDGLPETQDQLTYGSVLTEPSTVPTRTSASDPDIEWVFTGWYTNAACTDKFDFSQELTSNWTVLYAGWHKSEIDIDKTANPTVLGDDNKTNVTLHVGAGQSERNVAVLFVLDYSTSVSVRDAAEDMLKELASKENTNVKVCVINYWADCDAGEWITIDSETDTDELLAATQTGGTNLHGGLLKAQEMLESSEISGYETYLITISDGISYLWTDEDTGKTMSVWYQNRANGATDIQNGNDVYSMKYKAEKIPEGVFAQLVNGNVEEQFNNTKPYFEEYATSKQPGVDDTDRFLSFNNDDYESVRENYLIGPEISIYKSAEVYRQLVGEVDNAFALKMDENHWATSPYGEQLMDWMIGQDGGEFVSDSTANDVFAGIRDDILYEIKSGVVTDTIFRGELEDGVYYDFDLTDAAQLTASTFTLTVGGQKIDASKVEGNKVYFGTADNDGNYPYSVEYTTQDDEEVLIWNINVPVEATNPVELTYSVTLVEGSDQPGAHRVPTNKEAHIDYTSTDGTEGTKEFPVPEVTYTVTRPDPGPTEGDLTIEKRVTGNLASEEDEFTFTITLADASGSARSGDYDTDDGDSVTFTNGVATVRLHGGESVTIEDIPAGTRYAVSETNPGDYELVDQENTTGQISTGGETVIFVNDKSTPDEPGTPDEPDTPDTPDEPDTPDTPDTPDEPSTPDTPDEPSAPSTPSTPSTPATPSRPSQAAGTSKSEVPDTGDRTNVVLPAALALGGVALVGGALVAARRRSK